MYPRLSFTQNNIKKPGFDVNRFIYWAESIKFLGIELPIHYGVPRPTGLTTLLKFVSSCWVRKSTAFLKIYLSKLMVLATEFVPKNISNLLKKYWLCT